MEYEADKECWPDIVEEWGSAYPAVHKLTESPTYYLKQVMHQMQKAMRESLVDFDLTSTQFTLLMGLMVLTQKGKCVTQMDLAKFLKLDKMMVSEVLRTLEKKGYILRVNNPNDKRAKSLIVTDKGFKLNEIALEKAVAMDEQFFSVLGDYKDEFVRMLKKFL
jgi:MarR family transcriptional regulator, organic hydroperoxide resistance regulator